MTDQATATAAPSAQNNPPSTTNLSSKELQLKLTELWSSTAGSISNWYGDRSETLPGEEIGDYLSECGQQTYRGVSGACQQTYNGGIGGIYNGVGNACHTTYVTVDTALHNCSIRASRNTKLVSEEVNKLYSDLSTKTAVGAKQTSVQARKLVAGLSAKTHSCTQETYACTEQSSKRVITEFSEPPGTTWEEHVLNMMADQKQPLASQRLKTRLLCFPCQCGMACSNACCTLDFDAIMTILFCCPCRTFFGIFPTNCEKAHDAATAFDSQVEGGSDYRAVEGFSEPEEVPYVRPTFHYALSMEKEEEGVETNYMDQPLVDEEPTFADEDEPITYDQVFELERQKRLLYKSEQEGNQEKAEVVKGAEAEAQVNKEAGEESRTENDAKV